MKKEDINDDSHSQGGGRTGFHTPVLLKEVLEGLDIRSKGIYVDCTFGGGGHSRGILERLDNEGRLIAFDQDDAVKENLPTDGRFLFVPHNFRHLQRFLRLNGISQVDGLLADLGVSSHQFDEAARGFSTRLEAEMDMRMDHRQTLTAFDVIATYSEERLHLLFEQYGEVSNARTLARTIVNIRKAVPLKSTGNFKAAVSSVVKGNPNRYFAQVFQALRIEVNDELGALKQMLEQVPGMLKTGGRVAIISFHSLEDRIVKNFLKKGDLKEEVLNPFETASKPDGPFRVLTKKPVVPGPGEIRINPRARSAKLRIAEKI